MFQQSDVVKFFFEAMREGYATNPKMGTIQELPGSKTIIYERGEFKLVDCWYEGSGGRSFGTTVIFAGQTLAPVWTMQYWGKYPPYVIPFLKQALAAEYNRDYIPGGDPSLFCGCRGPRLFQPEEQLYVYTNVPANNSSFWDCSGREEILDRPTGRSLGWHEYICYGLM